MSELIVSFVGTQVNAGLVGGVVAACSIVVIILIAILLVVVILYNKSRKKTRDVMTLSACEYQWVKCCYIGQEYRTQYHNTFCIIIIIMIYTTIDNICALAKNVHSTELIETMNLVTQYIYSNS